MPFRIFSGKLHTEYWTYAQWGYSEPIVFFPRWDNGGEVNNQFFTLGLPTINLTEDVPDWAKYEFAFYADTVAFNIQKIYSQAEMIEYFMIRTNVWNSYPLRCFAQIYFLDEGYTVIDSLYNPRAEIPAATVFDGLVSNRFESFRVDLTRERIDLLANSQYVVIYSGLEITEDAITPENANYFNLYGLKIQVAARVDFIYSSK